MKDCPLREGLDLLCFTLESRTTLSDGRLLDADFNLIKKKFWIFRGSLQAFLDKQ